MSIEKLEDENRDLKYQLKQTLEKLNQQQESVVKPLLSECMKRDYETKTKRGAVADMKKSLKILFAMIKSPKLCDLMFKAERKRYNKKQLEKLHEQSVLVLRQYEFTPENAQVFVDKFHKVLVEQTGDDFAEIP